MRKIKQWMFAAILSFCGILCTLTSCVDSVDNPAPVVVPNQEMSLEEFRKSVLGLHLDLSDFFLNGEELTVWDLKEDNSFVLYELGYNEDSEFEIDTLAGTWKPFVRHSIQVKEDQQNLINGIAVNFNFDMTGLDLKSTAINYFAFPDANSTQEPINPDDIFFVNEYALLELINIFNENPAMTRASKMGGNYHEAMATTAVTIKGGIDDNALANKNSAKTFYDNILRKLSGVTDENIYFNPNEKSFSREDWRNQSNIYIYDGVGPQTVENYRFSIVPLPWSQNVSNSNLPMGFCDNITPESGWNLVLNYCGSTISTNMNYFALYNNYTGVLRFFVYVPQTIKVDGGNDHAWEVMMTEDLSQHLSMRYGLPMDRTIVDKSAIGMKSSSYNVLVSPWIASKLNDNNAVPSPGWWAFDVDLSLYRPGFHVFNQQMRLQMRVWSKDAVTLSSTIEAQIKEKVPATTYSFNSLSGLGSILGDAGSAIGGIYSGITEGKLSAAAKSGISLAKWGYNMFTSVRDKDKPATFQVKQYIDGTISTEGLISGERTVTGISHPTFYLNQFDTEHTSLGQGVWNIKTAPVVYQYDGQLFYSDNFLPTDPQRPEPLSLFSDKKTWNTCTFFVFDPSSVDVELNPNVFPNSEIESIDVQSYCGVRKGTTQTTTDKYRQAFGMKKNEMLNFSDGPLVKVHKVEDPIPNDNPVYDFLYEVKEDWGAKYPAKFEKFSNDGKYDISLLGRGDENYLIEPVVFERSNHNDYKGKIMPSYEVTVVLKVKLKNHDEPLVYTRTYIPEIKLLRANNSKTIVKKMTDYIAQIKKNKLTNGGTGLQLLELQLTRMKKAFKFLKPDYEQSIENVTYSAVEGCDGGGWVNRLFDGDIRSDWDASIRARKHGSYWEFQFKASRPITPTKYTLTVSQKVSTYPNLNPQLWALQGLDSRGNWVQIDDRNAKDYQSDFLPQQPGATKTFVIKNPGTYQNFKVIIVNYWGSLSGWIGFWYPEETRCRIAEFRFED